MSEQILRKKNLKIMRIKIKRAPSMVSDEVQFIVDL